MRKSDANEDAFREAVNGLVSLDERVPGICSWWVAVDAGKEGFWDAALVADFEDSVALANYNDHPEHVAVATVISGVSEFAVFDSEIADVNQERG